VIFVLFVPFVVARAQDAPSDSDLSIISPRSIRVGALSSGGRVASVPLELYVARVLAGEGEPRAADAAQQALAIAIRTYALANLDRHGRDGYDVCDTTHCQVPRAATPASRRAAMATAGQVLTWRGSIAQVFYSASCGGVSEEASQVWPDVNLPYLRARPDDVHDADREWTLELSLAQIRQHLVRAGFSGSRLNAIDVADRDGSGRVARLRLRGLQPESVSGSQFRMAVGAVELRSTAFSLSRRGDMVTFTGRGFGHGVGLCVIGAGRRALRGESARAILDQYFPGLDVTALRAPAPPVAPAPVLPTTSSLDLDQRTSRAHADLSRVLGVTVAPITVRPHDTIEDFRAATGRPWWVSAVVRGTAIDLAPTALLAQREGVDATLRIAVAEMLVAPAFADRPLWVRTGAARYFANGRVRQVDANASKVKCPTDAELTLSISATAQREAESRAETCFAREFARTGDWRAVR
jgi:SpoIID/LytB domain protein